MINKKLYQKALAILVVFSMLLSLPVIGYAENDGEFQIKLVHTNDIHARVQENADSGIIGVEKLGSIIDSYTAGADMDLVLDSGDLFHGQPIATLVKGESIAQLAKACGYDAITAGNHDWSYGKDRLKDLCTLADMTMLTGNVVEDETGNKFFDEEFYTESVTVDGKELKVGIFGVIDPKIRKSTTPSNVEGLTFADPAAYANKAAAELKAQDCDIVIALTHTYAPDELAAKVSGVDLWLAGHEHIQIDKEVTDAGGATTRVIESGYYLYSLSLIEISGTLDDNGDAGNLNISVTPMQYADTSKYQSKESVTVVMNEITAAQAEKLNEKVGSTPVTLDGVWEDLRIDQQNLGNVVTDAYLLETDADVAFENAGGIRASIEAGDVTYGDILGVSPYGNYVVTKDITGAALKEIMETSLEIQHQCIVANDSGDYEAWPQSSGSYLQFGGMTVTFDPDKEEGSRVLSITVQGELLDEEELYTVATNNYVAVSSYYPQLAEAEETGQFTACDEILVRFFQQSDEKIAKSINSERLFTRSSDIEWTAGGEGTEKSPYLIGDLETLEILRDNVNSGTDYSGIYFKLTADIDMSEKYSESTGESWTPIGTRGNTLMDKNDDEKNKPFAGSFDGDGHKISGLYIYGTDECQGLFGYTADGAVKNLTVSGYVAGKDCIGGIAGWNSAVIENCVNECDVSGAHYDGPTEIISAAAGGISGLNQGKILKSSNIGNVNNEYYAHANDSVGGISGENWGTVENCYNTGEVSGRFEMGGITGLNKATIKNCYSTGVIAGAYRAGVSAENSGIIENSYYLSGTAEKAVFITRGAVKTEAEEKTAEEFADGTVAYLLQGAQEAGEDGSVPMVWGQTLTGENADAYPVLTNDSTRAVCKVTFISNNAEYAAAYANPDGTVTLPTAPKISGYTFVKWSKTNASDGEEFTENTAVTEDMTVYAITKKLSSGGGSSSSSSLSTSSASTPSPTVVPVPTFAPVETEAPSKEFVFVDVPEDMWYYNSVKYVFENGLMTGISETEFAPEMDITRAMFVTVLYRAAGAPDMSEEIWGYPFEDVDAESWYGAAVYWARNNDIVQGYSDEKFAPDEPVTREQMAAILYRYAKLKGDNTEVNGTLNYTDNADISDYAINAVIWNLDNGIMFGNGDNTFAPKANTTRAEAAAVFERIMAE
ncbi:MAG: 5'-nucleotidase C-terminal domain-containing protein [Clostridiales bacterium]|nr:5'-nucleotidase C-terminal domain-containing protein [Clostridiales bacterium]